MLYRLLENTQLTETVWRMKLEGDTSAITAPGQFVQLSLPGFYLRRPISICDWDDKTITLVYKVVGDGTAAMAAMLGLALQIDRHLHRHIARRLEGQGQVDHVALLQRTAQAQQHHMMAAALHDDLAIGGDLEPFLDMDHPHHPIGILAMGVQLDLFGHIRGRADQPVIRPAVVVDHHEDPAGGRHRRGTARVGVMHLDPRGQSRKRHENGRRGRKNGGFERHRVFSFLLQLSLYLSEIVDLRIR